MSDKHRKKKSKKATSKKKTKQKVREVIPKNLTPAKYNPRAMDEKARGGLSKSMDEFKDISGITWNRKTGNIVTGHHRWEEIAEAHGVENLEFSHLKGDKYSIDTKDGEDTGYILRVVDWDIVKEKAANVTANSSKVEGIFTIDLKDVLEDISLEFDEDVFADLRLDDLLKDNTHFGGGGFGEDDNWTTDIEKVEKVNEDDHQIKYAAITVTCKAEDKERVLQLIEKGLKDIEVKFA